MKTFLLILAFSFCSITKAQIVQIEIPSLATKELKFWLHRGAKTDTIQGIKLDALGKATFSLPEESKEEIVSFKLPKGELVNFVSIPNERVSILCFDKECSLKSIIIDNSPTNKIINNAFERVYQLKRKYLYLENLNALYDDGNNFKPELLKEKNNIDQQSKQFNDSIFSDTTFISEYIQLKLIADELTANSVRKDDANKIMARNHFINDIDFDDMYKTGLWFSIINNTLGAYFEKTLFYGMFGNDVVANLKKIKSQEAFDALTADAMFICNRIAWNSDKEKIEDYLISSNRIALPMLKELKEQQLLRVGKKAPNLIVATQNKKDAILPSHKLSNYYTLLLFHETGCSHCEEEISKIIKNYSLFEENKVRIISFSSDLSQEIYEEKSKLFPWKDYYCSGKGMEDENFKNYKVIGAPSFFLLDKKGVIVSKGHSYESILLPIQNQNE